MQAVAIFGAGELGGAIAHLLARRDLARTIGLVDDAGTVATGKALDIAQAAPIEGFATQLSGSIDAASAFGSDVIVLAETAKGGEWQGDAAQLLLRQVAACAPNAIVICAGASHRDVVERGIRDLAISPDRLVGTAPEALAGAGRAIVALAVNGSPTDVALSVLGVPPTHIVVPWEDATIAGVAVTRTLDEPTRRRVGVSIAGLWPPGPHALAAAAVKAIESIAGRGRHVVSCFVGPNTKTGTRTRTASLPVRLGANGIIEILTPSLSVGERVALENAMTL
jgi:malate dehydrogenase